MPRPGYVYIMTNTRRSALYTGVTSDLQRRVGEHKCGAVAGFTKRYHLDRLVYFRELDGIAEAIMEEKRIKGGSRTDKIAMIEELNPCWKDLADGWG